MRSETRLDASFLGSAAWLEERTADGIVSQKLNLALDSKAKGLASR